MSLAKSITCKSCGTKFMDVFYTCPNCRKERDPDVVIIQNEMVNPITIALKSEILTTTVPLPIDTAIELHDQGKYLYATREYIRLFSVLNIGYHLTGQSPIIYDNFALKWYKSLVCTGDFQNALILLLYLNTKCIAKMGRFAPSHLHSLALICCIEKLGTRTLLDYMKELSGDPAFVLPKTTLSLQSGELLSFIEITRRSFPDVYDFVVSAKEELPKI